MSTEAHNKVQIVNEQDEVIGAKYLPEALRDNDIRRISRVLVRDTVENILLQKRSAHVLHPHLYTTSAGGHVDEGETYLQAAVRETNEELGLLVTDRDLNVAVKTFREPNAFIRIYTHVVQPDQEILFDPQEVEQVLWCTHQEVDSLVAVQPAVCTASFIKMWSDVADQLVQ